MSALKDGHYWLRPNPSLDFEIGEIAGRICKIGGWPLEPAEIGPRISSPEELLAQSAELTRLKIENYQLNRDLNEMSFNYADYRTESKRALAASEERARGLMDALNTPEIENFDAAIPLEAAHQVQRWSAEHDAGKAPEDWFWLIGYLAGKALHSAKSGDTKKAKHHCISTAAALRNWHAHLRSGSSAMRPGIEPPEVTMAPAPPSIPTVEPDIDTGAHVDTTLARWNVFGELRMDLSDDKFYAYCAEKAKRDLGKYLSAK